MSQLQGLLDKIDRHSVEAKAFAVLGDRAGLMIADPITASDVEGAARLRATFQGA